MLKTNKIFAWRWDIDHLYGLEKGVPNILAVSAKHNVKCSFFVNLGRSMSMSQWFLKSPSRTWSKVIDKDSINIVKKLGYYQIFRALFLVKEVGRARLDILKRIVAEGHELGLHGLFDHVAWSRDLDSFSVAELSEQVEEALCFFRTNLGYTPDGFVAPGFKWNLHSLQMIDKYFMYASDIFDTEPFRIAHDGREFKHMQIPVTICGPRTIPFIEYLEATGMADHDIITRVQNEIVSRDIATMYGHPCFEGLKTELLDRLFWFVQTSDYRNITFSQIHELYKSTAMAVRSV